MHFEKKKEKEKRKRKKKKEKKKKKSFKKNTKLKLVGGCVCLNALTKNENEKSFLTLS